MLVDQKSVYALKTGCGEDRTEWGPPKGNCTAKLARIGETAASVVRGKEDKMEYREHTVPRGRYRIYAREYAGEEPAIVLMHGFPDNLRLYDRLIPHLSGRQVVVFDFLGRGDRTSRAAIRIRRTTRPATSTRSSST